MLLNALYMAIVDGWSIYDEYPSETTTNVNAEDYNVLEALVSYLSTEDKESLCKILGRPYLENEETQVTLPVSLPT